MKAWKMGVVLQQHLHLWQQCCKCKMQVELDHTVSLSLQIHELNTCASAKLAFQSLITKAYSLHRGVAVQPPRPGTTPAPRPDMTNLTATLGLDGRMDSVVGMLQQYGVSNPQQKASSASFDFVLLHTKQVQQPAQQVYMSCFAVLMAENATASTGQDGLRASRCQATMLT